MKKALIACLVACALCLTACGSNSGAGMKSERAGEPVGSSSASMSSSSTTVVDNRGQSQSSSSTASSAAALSDNDFTVKEYLYENSIGTTYDYLAITNNSTQTTAINVNGTAYDAAGNVVGAASDSIDVLGPGETSVAQLFFSGVKGVTKVDYKLGYDGKLYYDNVISSLDTQVSINDKNAVVTVTNKGQKPAEFLEAYAIFLNEAGQVVDTGSTYIVDDNHELKPGETLSGQINSYEPFSSVEVFFTGRAEK